MKKLFLLFALVGFVFTACQGGLDNEENGGTPSTPKIELSQQSVEVEFESAEYEVTITSPYSWEATAKNDWIKVITETGIAGTKTLKFSVARNEEEDLREGTIVVKNEDYNLVAELYITQKAFVPEWTIETETLAFAVEGGTQEIAIIANFEYTYSANADWLTIEKSEKGISVTVPNYVDVDERTAEITISNEKYGISKVVKATQGAFVPEWTIEPESLAFAVEGGTQEVAITANFEYKYSTTADWLTIKKSGSGIKVTAQNNVEVDERTAEITISNEKYGISKVVNVTQNAFVPAITIEPESLTFTSEGGTQEVAITANFECTYSANADWLTIEKSESGIKVTAKANTNFEERTAEITISSEKYGVSKTIAVTQKGVSAESQNVILYTSSKGNVVTPYNSNGFGANIVSNTYRDGQGVIIFDAPVTSIGEGAFHYCSSLTSVTIPDSVTSIGYGAFASCRNLTEFYGKFASADNRCLIVDGVLNSFAPAGLTEYTIPDSVTWIGSYAFGDCDSLKSVTIPDSVTSVGYAVFADCSSLTSVTIGNSVTSIGGEAFRNCYNLTGVDIPNSVTSIGSLAFHTCSNLTSVTIGNGVTSIGESAFEYCTSLASVTIPNSVTSIGSDAFYNCTSLTSVTIGNSVTEIGERAFYECSSLTSITIGNGVTSIGGRAFYDCSSLTSVYCKPTTPPTGGNSMFSSNASGRKIYVPTASVDVYKSASGWSKYASYIEGYDF